MEYRYSVDSRNSLLIKSPRLKNPINPGGSFRINKDNQLEYWLNEPQSWRNIYNLPRKIVFTGRWSLNPNHDLELTLNKTRQQRAGERLTLKGEIISVDNNTLAFEIITRKGEATFSILKLTGNWQVDELNRIIFLAEKKRSPDSLILKAGWQVNKNQQIEYAYEKNWLARGSKSSHTLDFEGYWNFAPGQRLVYILSHSRESRFDFKAQIENPNVFPQQRVIKYRLGAGIRKPNTRKFKIVCLYGEWKISRSLGLAFRMDYGGGKIREMEFGAEVSFGRNKVSFFLKDENGEPLGITLTYTYSILSKLEPNVFIRLKSCQKKPGIEAGITIPF